MRLAGGEKSHHSRVNCILSFCALPACLARIAEQIRASSARRPSCTDAASAMRELLADRFVASAARGSTCRAARACVSRSHRRQRSPRQIVWSDRCAERARLRHPLMNVLVDYGAADNGRTLRGLQCRRADPRLGPARHRTCCSMPAASWHRGACRCQRRVARVALREVVPGRPSAPVDRAETASNTAPPASGCRAGARSDIILQPRAILESLSEALEVAAPGGTTSIEIAGGRGQGFARTRLLAARTARLAGFVPVASSRPGFGCRGCASALPARHLCVLLDDHTLERTGDARDVPGSARQSPARGGTCCFDSPGSDAASGAAHAIDSMGIAAMTSMVFVDGDSGPSHEELFDAARGASGRPGPLPRAPARGACRASRAAHIALVHESSPAYVFAQPGARHRRRAASAACCTTHRTRRQAGGAGPPRVGAASARARVARARGARRAGAGGGLRRAAGLDCSRSRPQRRALEQFERARTLSGGAPPCGQHSPSGPTSALQRCARSTTRAAASARIGIGIVWTDERRSMRLKRRSAAPVRPPTTGEAADLEGAAPAEPWPAASSGRRATTRRRVSALGALLSSAAARRWGSRSVGAPGARASGAGRGSGGAGRRGRSGQTRGRRLGRHAGTSPPRSEAWRSFNVCSETRSRSRVWG